MKTFILSVFALFLWLSADVCSGEIDDDYWVNTNFPGAEVEFISNHGPYVLWGATVDNKIYEITYQGLKNSDWEKLNLVFEGNITTFNSSYIGTDKGLYRFHSRDSVYKVEYFHEQNIIDCYYNISFFIVLTDKHIYLKHDSVWVERSLPDSNKALISICIQDFDMKRIVGITASGELYISKDSCGSWKEVAGVPKDHKFSAVEWSYHDECFYLGSDKGLFILKDSLVEVSEYDGGSVSCIEAMSYEWFGKTDTKDNKPLFDPFNNAAIIIGTSEKGVYEYFENEISAKNDSLDDLHITCVQQWDLNGIIVSTKNAGVYRAKHIQGIPGSVTPLNLTPYALKISPNPAKSRATITFHNPEYAEIEIAIYDLFGRKVTDVHSGHLAEGDYNFPTDLSGLAAGSYFLKFGVGGKVGSLNMIVE